MLRVTHTASRVTKFDWGDLVEDEELVEKIKGLFRFHPPGYQYSPLYVDGYWDGFVNLLKRGKVPTGVFLLRQERIRKLTPIEVVDERPTFSFTKPPSMGEEREYQSECLASMQATRTGGLLLNATASGKTVIAGLYFATLRGTAVYIVDELTLLRQTQEALTEILGEEVGMCGGGKFEWQRITVATVQTLHSRLVSRKRKSPRRQQTEASQGQSRRRSRPTESRGSRPAGNGSLKSTSDEISPDIVIIDEIHELLNARTEGVVKTLNPRIVFGLTATLQTRKKAVLLQAASLAGPVLYRYPVHRGIAEKYLAKGVVIRIPHGPRWPLHDDARERYDKLVVESEERNRLVRDLAKAAVDHGHHVMVLVTRIPHVKILSEYLHNVEHRMLYGDTPKEERWKAIKDMRSGDLRLIISSAIFGKGIDIPTLDVTIDATAGSSKNRAQQRLGRGTRLAPGKKGLLHFDIADRGLPGATEREQAYQALGVRIMRVTKELPAETLIRRAERLLDEDTE